MGTGYTRNDTDNNIADGNVINAADFDGEFDAIVTAFSTSGHTHDGTSAEGGPVTVLGPAQDFVVSATTVTPKTTNTLDLGTSSLLFKDAFFDGDITTGGLIIDNAGSIGSVSDANAITISSGGVVAVTATTASSSATTGALTVAGGAGVAADLSVGDDLRLISDSSVLSFGADSDVTLTHVADTGLLLNSTMALQFNDSSQFINAPSATVLDINATDEIELNATLVDINANVDVSGTLTVAGAVDFGDAALSNVGAVQLDSIAGDGDTNTSITFSGSDVITVATGGSTAMTVDANQDVNLTNDLHLKHDAAVLNFGADNDVTLTHVADTGLLLNSTSVIQFNDASQKIGAPNATTLDIDATDEIELNATLVDVNANLDVSGTYTGAGLMTTGGNIVIPDAGNIGSASDTDAIAIASDGVVTLTQKLIGTELDISGNIDVDGTTNLDVVDIDGAVDMASTLAVGGVVTANAGVAIDNITIDGTEIDLSSGSLTIDAHTDIILDADSGNWRFKDDGTSVLEISRDSNTSVTLFSAVSDMDILFKGNDGGGTITALTLDMSEAGAATFNSTVTASTGGSSAPSFTFSGDTNTGMFRSASDTIGFTTGGTERVQIGSFGVAADTLTNKTASGGLTLDAAGDITLDADGNEVFFKHAGDLRYEFKLDSTPDLNVTGGDFTIQTQTDDADILFKGSDGGSGITALTLDMSQAGEADFNSAIKVAGGIVAHQTDRGVLEYTSNKFQIRSYGNSSGSGQIEFKTGGGGGSTDTLAMTIDNNQNVGIGTGSSSIAFSSGSGMRLERSGVATLRIQHSDDSSSTFNGFEIRSTSTACEFFSANNKDFTFSHASELMRIDSSGRVGIGGTPNTSWRNDIADQEVLMLGTEATFFSDGGVTTELWNNAYVDNSDVFKNISTRGASRYFQYQGEHKWFTAASASAGSTITSEIQTTPKMVLDVNGNLGIGATSPKRLLHLNGGSESVKLQITNTTTGSSSDGDGFQIGIATDGTANLEQREDADMVFSTDNTARMTLDANGNVFISTSNASLTIGGSTAATDANLTLQDPEPAIMFHDSTGGQNDAAIQVENGQIRFLTGANGNNVSDLSQKIKMHSGGNLEIVDGDLIIGTAGHGIDFSAQTSTSASGAATDSGGEILDHYEEGTWTPNVGSASGSGGTSTSPSGRFTRIGNRVFADFFLTVNAIGSMSGNFFIVGFPFPANSNVILGQGAVRNQGIGGSNDISVTFEMVAGGSYGRFHFASGTSTQRTVQVSDVSSGDFIAASICYIV